LQAVQSCTWVTGLSASSSFTPGRSSFVPATRALHDTSAWHRGARRVHPAAASRRRSRAMHMFFGQGESFFGIGPAEAAVVMAVGYFVLGPTELYKLTKAVGQVIGQFKDFGLGTVTNLQASSPLICIAIADS
jgi:hypothetical protein